MMLLYSCTILAPKKDLHEPLNCEFRVGRGFNPKKKHYGVDLITKEGCPVLSVEQGLVHFAGTLRGYGKTVIVKHSDFFSLYAHLSQIIVKKGQKVQRGEKLGSVGRTGNASTPHLHLELFKNGQIRYRLDPNIFWRFTK